MQRHCTRLYHAHLYRTHADTVKIQDCRVPKTSISVSHPQQLAVVLADTDCCPYVKYNGQSAAPPKPLPCLQCHE
jgi:hypothetical protein